MSTPIPRPFITQQYRMQIFKTLHGLAHQGVKATTKLITQCYVWPSIKEDCRKWTQACIPCQKSKVHRHTMAPTGNFANPSQRFQHIHIDIVGSLPVSEGKKPSLTDLLDGQKLSNVSNNSRVNSKIPVYTLDSTFRSTYKNYDRLRSAI